MPPDHDLDVDVEGPRLIQMWTQQSKEKNKQWYDFQREGDQTQGVN